MPLLLTCLLSDKNQNLQLCIGLSKGNAEKSRAISIGGEEKKRSKAEYSGKVSTKEYYGHPTQKPIGLLSYLILNRTDENELVFDPFAGVSSTMVACKLFNRKGLAYEMDPHFYDLSIKRLEDKEPEIIDAEIIKENK